MPASWYYWLLSNVYIYDGRLFFRPARDGGDAALSLNFVYHVK